MASNSRYNQAPQNYGSQLRDTRSYYTNESSDVSRSNANNAQNRVSRLADSNKDFMNAMLSPRGRQQNWEAMKRSPLISSFLLIQLASSSIPLGALVLIGGFIALTSLSIAAFVASFFIFWTAVFLAPVFFFTVPLGCFLWLAIVLAWRTYNYFSDDIHEQTHAIHRQANDISENLSQNYHAISNTISANVQDVASNLQYNASAIVDDVAKVKHEIEANAEKEYYGYKDNVRQSTDKVTDTLHRNTDKVADTLNSKVNEAQNNVNSSIDQSRQNLQSTAQQAEDRTLNENSRTQGTYRPIKYDTRT